MVRDTREMIIYSFFKLAARFPQRSNFTLTEIADEAGLSRQTIYQKHFKNYDEILDYIIQEIDDVIESQFLQHHQTDLTIQEYFAYSVIPELYNHRTWLKYLYSTAAVSRWRQFLKEKYSKWMLESGAISHTRFDKRLVAEYVVNATLAIIETWICQDVPTPPEIFANDFLQVFDTPISAFLS